MRPNLRPITQCEDLAGKRVLVRVSVNVPVVDGVVQNQFRLLRGLGTINYLTQAGAKVIMFGHISNTKETEKTESLQPVFDVLQQHIPQLSLCSEIATPMTKDKIEAMQNSDVLLLENVRRDPREKKNDADFARAIADLGDMYVNDAFAVSHRSHASVVGVPQFLPSYAGLNFMHEYQELTKALEPAAPALFMLGGAKFDTKMPLVEKYLEVYQSVFIGGALANDFFKVQGHEVGDSLVSDAIDAEAMKQMMENPKLILPTDVTVLGPHGVRTVKPDQVEKDERILDAGPETVAMLAPKIAEARTILWNGPFGDYEHGFDKITLDVAKLVADATGYSILGGGDTIAAIEHLGCQEKYGFMSTAGGAMLHYLEHGTLPAIQALVSE